ncbi:DALR anticodon-binding domain-containing protein [Streptomyces sp. TRM 70361]|uniref:arginine--tRNA ligase n=1 Tax=Streptomyces sp. TRM 70361 TaxID=3116553 RepID=UPI002E7C3512|nr:DALR anticodon-binding domain-containing protein [Streptomyces sp. TRM 70361]MEE1938773.1 DALR anticodon-binding domain-containing protein [Streptomyces sp. TRM 70361]
MTPAQLSRTVLRTVRRAAGDGALGALPADALGALDGPAARITVGRPPHPGRGDYATNAALRLAAVTGRPAHRVAEVLRERLAREEGIAEVAVAGPGFLNITVADRARAALVAALAATDGDAPVAESTDPARDLRGWAAATGVRPPVEQREGNPLFLVQYAHARTRALLRNARDLGFGPEPGADGHPYDGPRERELLGLLAEYERIAAAGSARLARHLTAVADAFLDVHASVLPAGERKPRAAHRARLALAQATGAVLAGGLSRLGVTAPAHL